MHACSLFIPTDTVCVCVCMCVFKEIAAVKDSLCQFDGPLYAVVQICIERSRRYCSTGYRAILPLTLGESCNVLLCHRALKTSNVYLLSRIDNMLCLSRSVSTPTMHSTNKHLFQKKEKIERFAGNSWLFCSYIINSMFITQTEQILVCVFPSFLLRPIRHFFPQRLRLHCWWEA